MSLEQAINDHASAIRELAAAMIKAGQPRGAAVMVAAADTIEQDVTKVETDAKAEKKKVMDQVAADRKHDAKSAVAEALKKAEAAKAKPVEEDDPLDAAPMNYDEDVKPTLVQVGKNRDELAAMLGEFGVKKGDQLAPEQFAKVLARSNEILAARG